MKMLAKKILISSILFTLGLGLELLSSNPRVFAQDTGILWSAPLNISNSPEKNSVDPFLLADPAGIAHLFWAEQLLDMGASQADTLMYAQWDGSQWSKPIDIFFAPPEDVNLIVMFPHAVIDDNGKIHLIWMGEPNAPNYGLYYSSVDANQAKSPRAWEPRTALAADLTGTEFSIFIAYSPPQTLHVIYARVPASDPPSEERAVTYIRSDDGGENWSEPVDIYTISDLKRGASSVYLLVEAPNKVYASWTEWDETGNGQAVYFARSLDNGHTWEKPIRLAERVGTEYERDLNALALLGPNQIVSIWEGGWHAYRGAMYSYDGGATWSEPIDIFPFLVGDNGPVEFTRDSLDRLHLFISQRIREGYSDRGQSLGLWHSVWEGGTRWTEPTYELNNEVATKNMYGPKAVVINGNQVVSAWFGYQVYDIWVMTGVIPSAPSVSPKPWPAINLPTQTPTPNVTTPVAVNTDIATPLLASNDTTPQAFSNSSTGIMVGILASLILVISVIFIQSKRTK